jgi:hypothetical protein
MISGSLLFSSKKDVVTLSTSREPMNGVEEEDMICCLFVFVVW